MTPEELSTENNVTIADFFHDSMQLCPDNIQYNRVMLFDTDAAPYMVKAAEKLKKMFSKMLHIRCVVMVFILLLKHFAWITKQ